MNKKVVKISDNQLRSIIRESVRKVLKESYGPAHITYDGLQFDVSQNGADIYIEWSDGNRWVLAGWYDNDKKWFVQENLSDSEETYDGDNIIDIWNGTDIQDALNNMATYIKNHKYVNSI